MLHVLKCEARDLDIENQWGIQLGQVTLETPSLHSDSIEELQAWLRLSGFDASVYAVPAKPYHLEVVITASRNF